MKNNKDNQEINAIKPAVVFDKNPTNENQTKSFVVLIGSVILIFFIYCLYMGETKLYSYHALARIFGAYYCGVVAKKQYRKRSIWGLYGFLAPGISLLKLGLMKKIQQKYDNDSIELAWNNRELLYTILETISRNPDKEAESIAVSERILELDPKNSPAIQLLVIFHFKREDYQRCRELIVQLNDFDRKLPYIREITGALNRQFEA